MKNPNPVKDLIGQAEPHYRTPPVSNGAPLTAPPHDDHLKDTTTNQQRG